MADSAVYIWWLATRPKTLWAAAAPVVIGTAMAFADGGGAWLPAVAALFGAVMIQVGTNFANDYFDYKSGVDEHDRLGPTRLTQAGLVKPEAMKRATVFAFGLAAAAGIYLVWCGGWPIALIGFMSIACGILYTAGPFPLGYNGLGDLFVFIFFGPVAVGGTYYVQTMAMDATVLSAAIAPGLFSVAILTVNNLRDIDSDRAAGKKTLAVRFGRSFSKLEYLTSIVVASSVPALLYTVNGQHPWAMLTLIVPVVAASVIRRVFTTNEGPPLNDALAATGKLLLLYSVLFSIGWLV